MCGIAGFIDYNKKADQNIIDQMSKVLRHRGPDDGGTSMFELDNAHVGLAHRRLSILDLSMAGHQPMQFEHLHLVFNGEIYNFKEIKDKLKEYGYTFKSESDTEVILRAFHKWGVKAVDHFIGMFAFAIFDSSKEKVYLFRDRAGVKPLYYYRSSNVILFASELKSFHEYPEFKKDISMSSLSLFLQYSYIPTPHCIFKNTYKLKPGHYLEIDVNTKAFSGIKYWDVIDAYNEPKLDISFEEALVETEKILTSAFEYRMVADVPVGLFLSGGYDSVAVAAILQQERQEKIKTFTIGYKEFEFNEAPEAKKIAEYLGTEHTEYYCGPEDAKDIIHRIPEIYDEPFADNSVVPTILVSTLARKHVKVSLGGDAGDEIFGGYNKFNQANNFTQQIPHWLQAFMSSTMGLIDPSNIPYFSNRYNFSTRYEKMRKIWRSGSAVLAMKYINQYITEKELQEILLKQPNYIETFFDDENLLLNNNDNINKMLAIDYKTFLLDNNLVKVDRATMSVGLEGREPFLDHRIVEFISRLPSTFKIKNGINKYLLKEIVHKRVPKNLMERPKKPFIAPLKVWFKDELKELFLTYLNKDRLRSEGIFNADVVGKLKDDYLSGKPVNHQKLWNLLIFQMWKERWMN